MKPANLRLALALAVSLLAAHAGAAQSAAVGVVLSSNGSVTIRDSQGIERQVTRRMELFENDTVVASADGAVQLRLSDATTLSLSPNSELSLTRYRFDADPQTPDTLILTLANGGMRTILGSIGRNAADEYRVDTPNGSVGRSTPSATYGVILSNDALFVEISTGGINVSNEAGQLTMGLGGDYDYAQVNRSQAPIGLLQQPASLIEISGAKINGQPNTLPAAGLDKSFADTLPGPF